jgi:FKBP-type peptidyl-prolyl cis-trans isomerase 2
VDYIGSFEDGTVFDTSYEHVALDDSVYPKSQSFAQHESNEPLSFVVGEGQMIAGFDKGVIGMAVNQTRTLVIQPDDGYGYPDESRIQNLDLIVSVPILEWSVNTTDFQEIYNIPAVYGATVTSHEYGWNMTVFYIDPISDIVQLRNEPVLHEILHLNEDWLSEVISIDTSAFEGVGEIIIKHKLTHEDIGKMFLSPNGEEFTLLDVDLTTNTASVDFNKEVVGKVLIFRVTLVSITTD